MCDRAAGGNAADRHRNGEASLQDVDDRKRIVCVRNEQELFRQGQAFCFDCLGRPRSFGGRSLAFGELLRLASSEIVQLDLKSAQPSEGVAGLR